jgi:S-formylglutathione hydrolase FrmB
MGTRRSHPGLAVLAAALAAAAWAPTSIGATARAAAAEPPAAASTWQFYTMRSQASGKIERFWIGHAQRLKRDDVYPVLYCLPGLLDNDTHWKNALDPHLAKYEMIAVCPSVGGATWFMNSPAQPWMKWGDFLTQELRAFVEANYPASHKKGQRGIAGISSGAHGALYQALETDLYGSVGLLSGAMELRGYAGAVGLDYWIGPPSPETAPLYAARSCMVILARRDGSPPFDLFLDSGDKDGAQPQMAALKRVLDAKGATYKWYVGQGGHNWAYWKSRAEDHLAWHAEQFARNRREGRFKEEAPRPKDAGLTPAQSPDIALCEEAAARLRAPWKDGGRAITLQGLAPQGAPLAKGDPARGEVTLAANLPLAGHEPALAAFDLDLVVSTPLERAGTLTLTVRLRNGRGASLAATTAPLALAAGESNRRLRLHARLAVELKGPDALRGGIILGLQPFGADGNPVGDPVLGKAKPGTLAIESWPLDARARVEVVLSAGGLTDLPLAAVYEARLAEAPAAEP